MAVAREHAQAEDGTTVQTVSRAPRLGADVAAVSKVIAGLVAIVSASASVMNPIMRLHKTPVLK